MPSEFEVPILQILYPPDGSIPAKKGAMDHEICLAVVRNFNENFTVMEMRQKVRALQGGLA